MTNVLSLEQSIYDVLPTDGRRRKVARLVAEAVRGTTLTDDPAILERLIYDSEPPEHPVGLIDEALTKLIQRPDILAFGNVLNWRFSEIRRVISRE